MKRRLICSIIILCLLLTTSVFANIIQYIQAEVVDYAIYVDNEEKKFEDPVVTINDRTYIPLRKIAETLGCDVNWDENNQKIEITSGKPTPEPVSEEQLKEYRKTAELLLPYLGISLTDEITVKDIDYTVEKSDKNPPFKGSTTVVAELEVDTDYYKQSADFKSNTIDINRYKGRYFYNTLESILKDKNLSVEDIELKERLKGYSVETPKSVTSTTMSVSFLVPLSEVPSEKTTVIIYSVIPDVVIE